jgi:hypothetical protein
MTNEPKNSQFNWELLTNDSKNANAVMRAKVWGGWIVHSGTFFHDVEQPITYSESMVFVPDPKHEWCIDVFG